ncbi:unnamed protein product [Adineta ricciae]|uniref:Uncharacterized protein n=1 Tax=Adineta ricciae TaxID=249248 RepID=A0A814WV14_ADIRI|nr:unnamed protein product [Adineta ricciae]CAF1203155.1 unnamed protein product [Adineta ricciae]
MASNLEFPDLLYPECLTFDDQPHEILLDQWPVTTMDFSINRKFVMQKIAPSTHAPTLRATAPPFTYSVAMEDLTHMNKYTLSTKYKNNSIRLIAKQNHLIYVTKKNQLNIQSLSDHIYDELWSNTTDHLSNTPQRRHVIETSSSIKLLDCFVENEQLLNIAVANHNGLALYSYNTTTSNSSVASYIETSDHTSILALTFNPYISSNAICIDKNYRTYLFNDDTFTYLHQLTDEKLASSHIPRQIFLDWDASPFLYTIADNHQSSCILYDIRVRNESYKELFKMGTNHPYLGETEVIRGYKTSLVNPYQHVFTTDYSLVIIDSRMPNRSAIHSHHELLRPPTSFTQTQWNNQHLIMINDQFNTNILEYGTDEHRRLTQTSPSWEVCPISNTRIYSTSNASHTKKELLLAQSIYFDVPTRDLTVVPNTINPKSFLLFQLNSAGNIYVQLFDEIVDKNEEKTWNPDPDNVFKKPPDCFQRANDYWSTKFLPLFQCQACLSYYAEPTNFTIVTPLTAMTHKSLRDFPTFKNDHQSTEKPIPAELVECPMCQCMPELTTQGQMSRARNWIQDWKSQLDDVQSDATVCEILDSIVPLFRLFHYKDEAQSTTHDWRKIFDYDELNETNRESTLWNEVHRPWWPSENPTKPPLE